MLYFNDGGMMYIPGSWDKTIKFWDCRTANPVHTETLPERVFAMDVKEELMVVACADKKVRPLFFFDTNSHKTF